MNDGERGAKKRGDGAHFRGHLSLVLEAIAPLVVYYSIVYSFEVITCKYVCMYACMYVCMYIYI